MNSNLAGKIETSKPGNNGGRREITPEEIGAVIDEDAAGKYGRIMRDIAAAEEALAKEPPGERRKDIEKQYDCLKIKRNQIEELFYRL